MLSEHEMQVHTRAINVMIVLSNSIFEVSIASFSEEITAGGRDTDAWSSFVQQKLN